MNNNFIQILEYCHTIEEMIRLCLVSRGWNKELKILLRKRMDNKEEFLKVWIPKCRSRYIKTNHRPCYGGCHVTFFRMLISYSVVKTHICLHGSCLKKESTFIYYDIRSYIRGNLLGIFWQG